MWNDVITLPYSRKKTETMSEYCFYHLFCKENAALARYSKKSSFDWRGAVNARTTLRRRTIKTTWTTLFRLTSSEKQELNKKNWLYHQTYCLLQRGNQLISFTFFFLEDTRQNKPAQPKIVQDHEGLPKITCKFLLCIECDRMKDLALEQRHLSEWNFWRHVNKKFSNKGEEKKPHRDK